MTGTFNSRAKAVLTVVVITITIVSIAFFITCNLSPLFISYPLHQLSLSIKEINSDYFRLLAYLEIPWTNHLELKNITLSPNGYQHFRDVRNYLLANELVMVASTILCLRVIGKRKRRKQLWELLVPLELVMVVLLIATVLLVINFPTIFVGSHYLLFQNLDWVMSPQSNGIILLMPVSFFMKLFTIWMGLVFFFLGLLWLWIRLRFLKLWFEVTSNCRN